MTAPKIEKLLTPYNFTNANNVGRIKYIVIHYVGALGGAWANCHYYASKYLGASAHYFVGFEGEIWQSVEDEDIAWHCGAKSYKHAECRNSNSIGIELCVRNKGSQADTSKDWYFEDATVTSAIELTQYLMKKYNVRLITLSATTMLPERFARTLMSTTRPSTYGMPSRRQSPQTEQEQKTRAR